MQLDVVSFEGDRAARRHGVAGIDGQVNQDLLNLNRVGHDGVQVAVGNDAEVNVLSNEPAQHFRSVGENFVQVEQLGLKNLATAERQHLPSECRSAFRGLANAV